MGYEKGYLTDTCLNAQDKYKGVFGIILGLGIKQEVRCSYVGRKELAI